MWRNVAVAPLVAAWLVSPLSAQQMSDAEYIRIARSAAPSEISAGATIGRLGMDGKLTVLRSGTNGFTCVVGVPGDPDAPFCADAPAMQWLHDAIAQAPAPTNTTPGIAYMAQGGVHHEMADGQIVMEPGTNTHPKREPPHWMIFWSFDPASSGLPVVENEAGAYIMFAHTPYAHLMVYQDPMKMKTHRGTR